MIRPSARPVLFLAAAACLILTGAAGALAQAPPGAPPPAVTVVDVKAGEVPLTLEYAARVDASRTVQVRAQAGGILQRRNFVEGAKVNAGDILFEIDPRPYEAQLARAQAQMQQAEAQLAQATRDAARYVQLAETGAGTTKARDDALSSKELAAASVAIANADVETAQLNLDYTKVAAPITGVTSLEQVPEGSLVGTSGDASLLTTIIQLDPAHVIFSASESEIVAGRALLEAQGVWGNASQVLSVEIMFGDGQIYPTKGVIDFASAGLDAETGTMRLRATVPNPDGRLLPGQFVRAIIHGFIIKDAIVVPSAAVSQGAQGQFVYTVDSDGNAEMRPLQLGQEVAGGWIVESGLKPGDRLITEGIIKVRPGAPVAVSGQPAGKAAP